MILVDAFKESKGVHDEDYDARKFLDNAVDLNFIDSLDSLLATNRLTKIDRFKTILYGYANHETICDHISAPFPAVCMPLSAKGFDKLHDGC